MDSDRIPLVVTIASSIWLIKYYAARFQRWNDDKTLDYVMRHRAIYELFKMTEMAYDAITDARVVVLHGLPCYKDEDGDADVSLNEVKDGLQSLQYNIAEQISYDHRAIWLRSTYARSSIHDRQQEWKKMQRRLTTKIGQIDARQRELSLSNTNADRG